MKIRQGFVSNSSSSSFCLLGIDVTDIDPEIILRKIASDDEIYKEIKRVEKYFPEYKTDEKQKSQMFEEMFWEMPHNSDYILLEGISNGVPKGMKVFGKFFMDISSSSGCRENGSVSIDEFIDDIEKFRKELDLPKKDVRIYWGTRMC